MMTWVLLRGLTRETRHWGAFPDLVQAAFPKARILLLELPGNGLLNTQTSPIRIEAMAAFCQAEMIRLELPPPYHLLGMSLGGMVATAWAEAQPEAIAACVLLITSFGAFSPFHHRLRPGAWPTLARLLMSPTVVGRERLVFNLTSSLPIQPQFPIIQAWAALRRSHPVGMDNALRQLLASARYRAPRRAPVPTLVLAGAGDRLVNPRCSLEIAHRWLCQSALHPFAGHDLTLDDGPWVLDQVCRWCAPMVL